MASKTLLKTGASFLNRLSNLFLNQSLHSNHQIVSHGLEITPKLFPSISKLPSSLQLQQNDAEPMNKLTYKGFLYPCGLPSMRFFLPDGNDDEPMHLFPKRTFQPSLIRRKRNHGFFARKATRGGRRVIARRIAKGRSRITA
ncbi:hypothetical protein L6164_021407 [Bauhinia variegata]|uniref:Uncharacterized protein n=1 Tax=Bauhinia variegata TaxID=167791 RepID=A0ACB9MYE3_BAUVA|nr:hypothetical protein L6164_021407 [Bauhinia variegata]